MRFNPAEPDVFATTGSDRGIALYDLRSSTPIRKRVMQTRTNAIAWNPMEPFNFTGGWVAAGGCWWLLLGAAGCWWVACAGLLVCELEGVGHGQRQAIGRLAGWRCGDHEHGRSFNPT